MPRARPPSPAEALVPPDATLDALRSAAATCKACDLWERGTQTVFGEGEPTAELVLVGEQPGDKEDLEGLPFVGPAGRVLDAGLEAAGIDRRLAYVTNAVKHFKWEPRGKVRLHKTPNAAEVHACRPWLEAELRTLRPSVLVCLGATAAKALLGPSFKVSQERGRLVPSDLAPSVLATVHPSSILRTDGPEREAAMAAFVDDLRVAATALSR
ncbi:MAG TPA: UdgX family uracil-DNA binding protein [Acidimicrobiales bacterium]|nr:UdgX family uracil-DNA binding protein [Acidimicrobiales bacterium]